MFKDRPESKDYRAHLIDVLVHYGHDASLFKVPISGELLGVFNRFDKTPRSQAALSKATGSQVHGFIRARRSFVGISDFEAQ